MTKGYNWEVPDMGFSGMHATQWNWLNNVSFLTSEFGVLRVCNFELPNKVMSQNFYHTNVLFGKTVDVRADQFIFVIYDLQWLPRNQLNSFQRHNLIAFKLSLLMSAQKLFFKA